VRELISVPHDNYLKSTFTSVTYSVAIFEILVSMTVRSSFGYDRCATIYVWLTSDQSDVNLEMAKLYVTDLKIRPTASHYPLLLNALLIFIII